MTSPGRTLGDLDGDAGIGLAIVCEQTVEETAGAGRIDADVDTVEVALRESAGRFDGMFDVIDAGGDAFHEMPARLGQAERRSLGV